MGTRTRLAAALCLGLAAPAAAETRLRLDSQPGDYIGQWEIVWNDDTIQTTQPANTISIRRQ